MRGGRRARLWLILALIASPIEARSADLPAPASPAVRVAVSDWMARHPGYELMSDADCGCAEDLTEIRTASLGAWKARPDYHPYFLVGDLDGDGRADAAIGVRRKGGALQVLIVHGPKAQAPYLSQTFPRGVMLFFGAPRPKPWRLLVGRYGTDTGDVFVPRPGHRYEIR